MMKCPRGIIAPAVLSHSAWADRGTTRPTHQDSIMKLYYHPPLGPFAPRSPVLSLLELPQELMEVDLLAGAHKEPAFIALNPFGQVPVLDTAAPSSQISTPFSSISRRSLDGPIGFPKICKRPLPSRAGFLSLPAKSPTVRLPHVSLPVSVRRITPRKLSAGPTRCCRFSRASWRSATGWSARRRRSPMWRSTAILRARPRAMWTSRATPRSIPSSAVSRPSRVFVPFVETAAGLSAGNTAA